MTVDEQAKAYCCKACNDEGLGCICHAEGCDVQAAYKAGYEAGYEQGTGRPYAGEEIDNLTKENAELKEYTQNRDKQVQEDIKIITELNEQIEKMKCCGNCSEVGDVGVEGCFCYKKGEYIYPHQKCEEWKLGVAE